MTVLTEAATWVAVRIGGSITSVAGGQGSDVTASVVMPARNAAATIGAQLEALCCQRFDGPWEVVIADNGSTDATAEIVASFKDRLPRLRTVVAREPGANHARNAGARAAHGDILVFCDADDEVQPGWLEQMVEAMDGVDAVGGYLELTELNDVRFWPPNLRTASRPAPLPPVLDFLPYPISANCAVRREVWAALGGFDEAFLYGGDEVEFFWRLQLAGYRLEYAPLAKVNYRLPASTWDAMRRGYVKGRATAQLYRHFAEQGARFQPVISLRSWLGLVGRSYRLLGRPAVRHSWLLRAAQQVGRLAGGVRQRRFFF